MKKKLGKLVAQILAEGREINIGPHDGFSGYYARVLIAHELRECKECEQPLPGFWEHYGHGRTPLEALENALNLGKTGSPHYAYIPYDFQE